MDNFTKGLPKKYKKDSTYSYALGPFPTFELLRTHPEHARTVYVHSRFREADKLKALCDKTGVPFVCSDKALSRISTKEICYAAAVFSKYTSPLSAERSHIVLAQPGDMGNLGTIIRTALGFGLSDIAVLPPAADPFHPKTIRASMGAVFRVNLSQFDNIQVYLESYGENRAIFPFMLDGDLLLTPDSCPESRRYSLIFGNEATGLPDSYRLLGKTVCIPQTDLVDSLNLAVSVGIGAYLFSAKNK